MSQIDALTLDDVDDLLEHWRESPPLVECVRAWLGIKPPEVAAVPESQTPRELTAAEFDAVVAQAQALAGNLNRAAQ